MGIRTIALAVAALCASGCAGVDPTPAIESAQSAVARAENAAARRYAPNDLARARDELDQARTSAQRSSEQIEARRLAEKAEADAELATERARAEQVRIALEQLRKSVREAGQ